MKFATLVDPVDVEDNNPENLMKNTESSIDELEWQIGLFCLEVSAAVLFAALAPLAAKFVS